MQVGSEEFGDKVDILEGRDEDIGQADDVLVTDVFQELEFSIGTLCEDRPGRVGMNWNPWVSEDRPPDAPRAVPRTHVENGFMIFLMATDVAVS